MQPPCACILQSVSPTVMEGDGSGISGSVPPGQEGARLSMLSFPGFSLVAAAPHGSWPGTVNPSSCRAAALGPHCSCAWSRHEPGPALVSLSMGWGSTLVSPSTAPGGPHYLQAQGG